MLKILIIGTLTETLENVGGTMVSLQHLVGALKNRDDVAVQTIDTAHIRGNGLVGVRNILSVFFKIVSGAFWADVVSLHVGIHALPILGPFVLPISRFLRKPVVVRRFGGVDHRELRGWQYRLADWIIRAADLYLVQTKAMVQGAREVGLEKVEWFPTSRPQVFASSTLPNYAKPCRNFIYLGQIKAAKGLFEIIDAAERFGPDVQVSIYGPFFEGLSPQVFSACQRVHYCGVLPPGEVSAALQSHDALLLPTYYSGEGYPGVILEAFNSALPVISTTWKAIPEIIDDTCGILIPPKDGDALYTAMSKMVNDTVLYARLRSGALEMGRHFSLDTWSEKFVRFCQAVIAERKGRR